MTTTMPLMIQNLDVLDCGSSQNKIANGDCDGHKRDEEQDKQEGAPAGEGPPGAEHDGVDDNVLGSTDLGGGEGAIIVVGDNDSVSSLDSKDSFADSSCEDDHDHDDDKDARRRQRQGDRHANHAKKSKSPRFHHQSAMTRQKQQQRSPRKSRIHRSNRRRSRTGLDAAAIAAAPRAVSLDHGILSPSLPLRQPTRESAKRPMPILSRNQSNPELISPKSQPKSNKQKDKTDSNMPNPRESLTSSVDKYSVRSLNCLELLIDEQEDELQQQQHYGIMEPEEEQERMHQSYHHYYYHSYHQPTELHKQSSGQSNGSSIASRWQEGDCESSANTASRWSASTGTANRSMNTAQLDQLSTVPRFPRRQRTGEGIKHLRNTTTSTSQDNSNSNSNNNTTSSNNAGTNNDNNSKEPGDITTVSGHTIPKKRPQLPNRQKSFRRSVLTMNQAAQVALAQANGASTAMASPTSAQQQLSPQQQQAKAAPIKPRRTISNDTTQTSFSRQKSLPNLLHSNNRHRQLQCSNNIDPLSLSLHNSPRIPERKSSSRIRRATSDGGGTAAHHIARLLAQEEEESDEDDDSHSMMVDESDSTSPSWTGLYGNSNNNNNNNSSNHNSNNKSNNGNSMTNSSMHSQFSRESSFSTGMNDTSNAMLPKMPRRQSSHEDMPPPAAVVASANNKNITNLQNNRIEGTIQEIGSSNDDSDPSNNYDSDDDEDDDEQEERRRGGMHLPPHLRGSSRECYDSSARLPLRQLSLSERREDDGGDGDSDDDDDLNFFKTTAMLGDNESEDDHEEEEPILLANGDNGNKGRPDGIES